jgi:hypothetical protein
MNSFKGKTSKLKYLSLTQTLDEIHKKYVNDYITSKLQIDDIKKRLETNSSNNNCINDQNVNNNENVPINELKSKLRKLENDDKLVTYFSCVGDIVVDYYNKKVGLYYNTQNDDIVQKKSIEFKVSDQLEQLNQYSKKFRKIKKPVKKRTFEDASMEKNILDYLIKDDVERNLIHERINHLSNHEKYLYLIDKSYAFDKVKSCTTNFCSVCGIEKTLFQSEGCYVCQKCGEAEYIIIESEIPSHKETLNEKPKYPYRKINHLKERLNQFQSKELVDIPIEVYDVIDKELKKRHINVKNITIDILRKILKQYKLHNYYEHIQQIYCKLSKKKPISLDRKTSETILMMFGEVQNIYKKYKPTYRNNFLNYSYVLNKLFLLLGQPQMAVHFPLLKSSPNLIKQDQIWKKICTELGWKFYKST